MGLVWSNARPGRRGGLTPFFTEETRAVSRSIAERGGNEMQEWTIKNTPIDSGNLRTSWYVLPVKRIRHLLGPAYQSGTETRVEYAPYVEHGTGLWGPSKSKYWIRPKNPDGYLRWRDRETGQWVYAKAVRHPGSPPQHMVAIA